MNFSEALTEIKAGKKAGRKAWLDRGYGTFVELVQVQSANDGRTVTPLLLVSSDDGVLRPFSGSNRDLLADDWEVGDGGS